MTHYSVLGDLIKQRHHMAYINAEIPSRLEILTHQLREFWENVS